MLIDINAFIGHYPFRALRHHSPEALIGLMDRQGIDRAVVSWLPSVFYRNVHEGNWELRAAVERYPKRLIAVATINPKYVGWQRDLEQAVVDWKMKAVALYPAYHGFELADEFGGFVLEAVEQLDVPVVLCQRLEDRRQRHAWDQAEDLDAKSLLPLGQKYPKLRVMLINWLGLDGAKLLEAGWRGRCLIDFARLNVLLGHEAPQLAATLGIDALAFGSHIPFDYVGPSLVKLSNWSDLSAAEYAQIAWQNAQRFLRLE